MNDIIISTYQKTPLIHRCLKRTVLQSVPSKDPIASAVSPPDRQAKSEREKESVKEILQSWKLNFKLNLPSVNHWCVQTALRTVPSKDPIASPVSPADRQTKSERVKEKKSQ